MYNSLSLDGDSDDEGEFSFKQWNRGKSDRKQQQQQQQPWKQQYQRQWQQQRQQQQQQAFAASRPEKVALFTGAATKTNLAVLNSHGTYSNRSPSQQQPKQQLYPKQQQQQHKQQQQQQSSTSSTSENLRTATTENRQSNRSPTSAAFNDLIQENFNTLGEGLDWLAVNLTGGGGGGKGEAMIGGFTTYQEPIWSFSDHDSEINKKALSTDRSPSLSRSSSPLASRAPKQRQPYCNYPLCDNDANTLQNSSGSSPKKSFGAMARDALNATTKTTATGIMSSTTCYLCNQKFCWKHLTCEAKVNQDTRMHDPYNGKLLPVCEECFCSREGYNDTEGYVHQHTHSFYYIRERHLKENRRRIAETDKILMQLQVPGVDPKIVVEWVPDVFSLKCTECRLEFNRFTRRRHHCRLCGKLYCKDCIEYFETATISTAVNENNVINNYNNNNNSNNSNNSFINNNNGNVKPMNQPNQNLIIKLLSCRDCVRLATSAIKSRQDKSNSKNNSNSGSNDDHSTNNSKLITQMYDELDLKKEYIEEKMYEFESLLVAFKILRDPKTKELRYKNPIDGRKNKDIQLLYKSIGQDLESYQAMAKKMILIKFTSSNPNSNPNSLGRNSVSNTQIKLRQSLYQYALKFIEKTKLQLNSLLFNSLEND